MASRRYRGFVIRARPYQLHQSKEWSVDLVISHRGRNQPVGLADRFTSRDDAEVSCARLGRRIIDGKVPGWSVQHLRGPSLLARALAAPFRHGGITGPLFLLGLGVALLGGYLAAARTRGSSRLDVLNAGDRKVAVEAGPTIPRWVGGVAVAIGAGLMVAGARRRT